MDKENENIILENREMPQLALRAAIVPGSIDLEARTVRVQYTTGARVYRSRFFEDDYYEELATDKGAVRLGRLNGGAAPVLNSHRNVNLADVMGVVLEANETHATLKFSERADVEPYWRDIVAGIIRSVSVGYMVYRYQDVTPDGDKIRILRAIDWEPFEISMVAIPADAGAGVRNMETYRCVVIGTQPETPINEGRNLMDKDENKPGAGQPATPAAAPATAEQIRAASEAATLAERTRVSDIRTLGTRHAVEDTVTEKLIAEGKTVDEARTAILDHLATRSEAAPIRPQIRAGGQDEIETRRNAVENALMHRAMPSRVQLEAPAREYRGMKLLDLAREFIGYHESRGLSPNEIVRRAFHSTSDFSNVLANVANKSLRQSYADTKRSFLPWARQTYLPDFKAVQRVALSNAPSLKLVVEGGEYEAGTFTDGNESYRLFTYGRKFNITREAIINDDMDAFTRVPGKMAAAAARLENRMVYDILLGNPVMGDGVALFHANHGNLVNNLLSVSGLGAVRSKMRVQKDPSGEDTLNYEGKFLIVPAALETTAGQLQAQITAAKTADVNPFINSFQIITEGYLDSVDPLSYYIVADPNEADTVEYAYLEGETGPYIESRDGFDTDGLQIKVRHDFATKAIDFRGMAKSTNNGS